MLVVLILSLVTLFTISVTEINFGICEQQSLHFLEVYSQNLCTAVLRRETSSS